LIFGRIAEKLTLGKPKNLAIMKKIILVLTAVIFAASAFATVVPAKKNPQTSSIMLPVGKNGAKISLMDFRL
jgi:hypothetical protein